METIKFNGKTYQVKRDRRNGCLECDLHRYDGCSFNLAECLKIGEEIYLKEIKEMSKEELHDYTKKTYRILKERAIELFIMDLTWEGGALATSRREHMARIRVYENLFGDEEMKEIRDEVKRRIKERGLKIIEKD